MPMVVKFESKEECVKAIDVLDEADETYHGVPKNLFIITQRAAELLKAHKVQFLIIGGKGVDERKVENQ